MPVFARLVQLGYRGVDRAAYEDHNVYKKIRDAADALVIQLLGEIERQTGRRADFRQGAADTRNWELGDPELIHELRRAALHLAASGGLPSDPPGVIDPTGDPLLREAYRAERLEKTTHLVRHSESSGVYVPLFFPRSFWMDEPGLSVGSAQGLLLETEPLANVLAGESPSSPWADAADYLAALREAAQAAVETGLTLELYWEEKQTSAGEV